MLILVFILAHPGTVLCAGNNGLQKVQTVIQELLDHHADKQRARDPRSLGEKGWSLSQPELNVYLNYSIKSKKRFGLKWVKVDLVDRDYIKTTVVVDFNQVKIQDDSLFFKAAKSLFSGEQTINFEGHLRGAGNGRGSFVLEKAYFGSMRIPAFVVTKIMQTVGRRQVPPVDPTRPVQLPYGIQKIEIYNGMLKVKS